MSVLPAIIALLQLLPFVPCCHAADDFPLSAEFSEIMITLSWPSREGISAYNIYADWGQGFVRANPVPVSSRTQFAFLWAEVDGERQKVVKGNIVRLYAVGLAGLGCSNEGSSCSESERSMTVATRYFEGFSTVVGAEGLSAVLRDSQSVPNVIATAKSVSRRKFMKLYPALTARVAAIYRRRIDPRDEGACVPFSTIVAKYFTARGIACYRVQGQFIKQFHSFNLVSVDGVEYVVDFTADQFLPSCSPVVIPRDFCFIDSTGLPTGTPKGRVTPMYIAEKAYRSDQVRFTATKDGEMYQALLDTLLME